MTFARTKPKLRLEEYLQRYIGRGRAAAAGHGMTPHQVPVDAGGVVIFDGTCAFCEGAMRFIARRDKDAYFRFGAAQTPAAQSLLTGCGVDSQTSRSLVLIEGGLVYLRSTASLRIARRLAWPWRMFGVLLLVPVAIRDPVYRVVAAVRHRLASRSNACEIPPPELRGRLI